MSDAHDHLTRIVYTGTVLGQCVITLTPSKRVYPREAIHRLVGLSEHEKVA